MRYLLYFLASMFGIGFIPWAPGTFGSLLSVGIYYYVFKNYIIPDFHYNILIFVVFLFGILISNFIEHDSKKRDPKYVVIDEFLGIFVTFWSVNVFSETLSINYSYSILIIGFLLFRFFDIIKPYPVNVLDNVRGGLGVMSDDFVAGVMANFLLKIGIFIYNVYIL